ncbi:hypothetical protein B0T14DRAFT_331473 [Immersiella caudata]|uniref:Uncharacterized protein n=1 Tax=Immersiella caudata TaxID=314043 RepID=A0AA39U5S9_9PEZI|nr:hypothetical protein B0T14DRAFT_331473 [Immersiella caudata]
MSFHVPTRVCGSNKRAVAIGSRQRGCFPALTHCHPCSSRRLPVSPAFKFRLAALPPLVIKELKSPHWSVATPCHTESAPSSASVTPVGCQSSQLAASRRPVGASRNSAASLTNAFPKAEQSDRVDWERVNITTITSDSKWRYPSVPPRA